MTRIYPLVIAIYFQVGRVSPPRPFGTLLFHHWSHLRGLCNFNLAVYPDGSFHSNVQSFTFSSSHVSTSSRTFSNNIPLRFRASNSTASASIYDSREISRCIGETSVSCFLSRGIVESNFEIIDIDIDIQAEKTRNKQSEKTRGEPSERSNDRLNRERFIFGYIVKVKLPRYFTTEFSFLQTVSAHVFFIRGIDTDCLEHNRNGRSIQIYTIYIYILLNLHLFRVHRRFQPFDKSIDLNRS